MTLAGRPAAAILQCLRQGQLAYDLSARLSCLPMQSSISAGVVSCL